MQVSDISSVMLMQHHVYMFSSNCRLYTQAQTAECACSWFVSDSYCRRYHCLALLHKIKPYDIRTNAFLRMLPLLSCCVRMRAEGSGDTSTWFPLRMHCGCVLVTAMLQVQQQRRTWLKNSSEWWLPIRYEAYLLDRRLDSQRCRDEVPACEDLPHAMTEHEGWLVNFNASDDSNHHNIWCIELICFACVFAWPRTIDLKLTCAKNRMWFSSSPAV